MTPAVRSALLYWEPRRLLYNGALAALVTGWIAVTWPHFRQPLTLGNLGRLVILAALANLCYCAAYVIDVPLQELNRDSPRRRWRFPMWLLGTLLALLFAQYWIGDEIYPFVGTP